MTFAFPWMLALGLATAAGVVALHLLSTQRPPARPLPTARFVPASDLRAVARRSRPTDLLLLALRVLAVLLIAAAFAQPLPDAPGPALRRVVALEWTTALRDPDAARRRAQALLGEGDALVVFDTAARALPPSALATLALPSVRGAALSPMLVALRDAAAPIAPGADSLAVTLLSGLPRDAWDRATDALRATWPGRIEVERLETVVDTTGVPDIQVLPADADDPLVAAVEWLRTSSLPVVPVRLRRGEPLAEDSLWLARTAGGVVLRWPREQDAAVVADGVFAAHGASAALVAPLGRRPLPGADAATDTVTQVIARWRDGTPAATERRVGQGCVRDVGILLPERGDVTLRAPFAGLLATLLEPCGGRRSAAPSDSAVAAFAGDGPLAAAAGFERGRPASPLTPWLLAAALLLLIGEQWWRRRQAAEVGS